ncbi:MAG: Nramp family divalent metal transporter [Candidatus Nitrosocosmicus sp.]
MKPSYIQGKKESFLRFLLYSGPAVMVSVAYMDPGNYGTDIQAGASLNYNLLWVVWLSSGIAMLLQYLSGKIGIATGQSLAEVIRIKLKKKLFIIPYWLSAEILTAATDLAEYLGTVIALNLLFNIPMIYAAVFGALDVILILAVTARKFRFLEQLFILLVSIISFGYLYELVIVKPDPISIIYHSFIPSLQNSNAILITVGIMGATVMPHAIFVHSWLTKNKVNDQKITAEKKRYFIRLHLIENIFILTIAGMVNAAIMIMAAAAFYSHGTPKSYIYEAYKKLVPLFGNLAGIIFLITLLSSGISSSIIGTLAGQSIMEGLLGKNVNLWLRRIITRFVNVIPTTIALLLGFDPLHILVYSQVILSLLIPLPVIPLVLISKNRLIMGEFVNKKSTTFLSIVFVIFILILNSYLIINSI